jgi:hypothetical protein
LTADELMLGMNIISIKNVNKGSAIHTFWYNYKPIEIIHSQNFKNIFNFNLVYQKRPNVYKFYKPHMLDFLNNNFENFFEFNKLSLAKRDLYHHFTYSFKIFSFSFEKIFKHNIHVFINRFYRYVALIFYDFFSSQQDPYLCYYKLIRKNKFIFPTYRDILAFPIFKNK